MGKAKGGRPTKYSPKYHPQIIELLSRLGYTEKESAEFIGISKSTLNNWKNKYPEFLDSKKRGLDNIINQIEHALYKRAIGYEYKETHVEAEIIGNEETKAVKKVKELYKQMAPDSTSIIFSLKNLAPEKWRDRKEIGIQGTIDVNNFDIELTEEEETAYKQRLKDFFGEKMLEK